MIDVNSGKNVRKKGDDESTLKMNLEAAKETARQIRLRNLSGIILIDFINQDEEKNEETLLKEFRYFLAKDPIQTTLVDITALGLAEVTRKKVRSKRDRIADAFAGRDNRGDANIMSKKELKTNAMRILDRNKIPYEYETYECDEFVDGITTADKIGLPHEQVYKTLVTVGKTGGHYVFVIPIAAELDLKKAAKSVGEKSVEMLHVKDITAVTGYVRGGCTAIGMKKQFPTVIDSSAQHQEYIYVSGGKIGMQIKLKPDDLKKTARAEYGEITF